MKNIFPALILPIITTLDSLLKAPTCSLLRPPPVFGSLKELDDQNFFDHSNNNNFELQTVRSTENLPTGSSLDIYSKRNDDQQQQSAQQQDCNLQRNSSLKLRKSSLKRRTSNAKSENEMTISILNNGKIILQSNGKYWLCWISWLN